jgi:protein gp37
VRSRVRALILARVSGECFLPSLLLGRAFAAALILARLSADILLPLRIAGAYIMGEKTAIEWCDHTLNPWIGCTKVSPACDNCYAAEMMDTRYGRVRWGAGEPRVRTKDWSKPRRWNRETPGAFVFCASLADVFDNEVPAEWRADLMLMIAGTPNLIWLLLTKRVGNVEKMVSERLPSNVAIGATMANQEEYDRDARKLFRVGMNLRPAFTFGSFEPLLGPVRLDDYAPQWIIVGGESGSNARPMDIDWARQLKADAAMYGRVFNFKQVGGRKADKGGHTLDGETHFARPAMWNGPDTIFARGRRG